MPFCWTWKFKERFFILNDRFGRLKKISYSLLVLSFFFNIYQLNFKVNWNKYFILSLVLCLKNMYLLWTIQPILLFLKVIKLSSHFRSLITSLFSDIWIYNFCQVLIFLTVSNKINFGSSLNLNFSLLECFLTVYKPKKVAYLSKEKV